MTFNILEHLDKLTLDKGKDRYICPVCKGNNLTINLKDGKYNCWSGCECKDIRNAIAPLEQPKKAIRPKSDRTWAYTDRDGNPSIRSRRTDDGQGKRKIWQEYFVDGQWLSGGEVADDLKAPLKQAIAPYKYLECQEAIARGETIYWCEGEPCADALWALGIAATTTIGGSASYDDKYGDYSCFGNAQLVIAPDRDKDGIKYSEAIASDYPAAQWLYAYPDSPLWNRLPKDGGLDIADWIDGLRDLGLSDEQIRDRIVVAVEPGKRPKAVVSTSPQQQSINDDSHGFEDYLSQIERLLQIEDPVRRGYEIWAYSKHLGCSPRQVETAIAHLSTREKPDQQTVFTLGEFLALPMSANQWIVPGLIPAGETLIFAGQPKEGKSLLAYDLAYSVATGKSNFLGTQPLTQGRVLMVLNDESQRSIQIRLVKRGFNQEDSDNVRIVTSFNIRSLSELEQHLIDFRPCVTIIDSLKSISRGSELSENSAEFADGIYNLKELLDKWGSAGVLIHHTNKDRESQGVAQLRGSTAIAGAVWGVWLLKTPQKRGESAPPLNRFIEVNPREGERKTLNVELEPENNSWKLIHAIASDEADQTAREKLSGCSRKQKNLLSIAK
jgi:KaiC/GvpD/RAD55 family RecA-like ATPase